MLVVFCHGAGEISANHPSFALSVWTAIHSKGLFGVDIFFVVSGFVMMYVATGQPTSGAAAVRFLGERIVRVVPLYWATTLLSVFIGVMIPALKHKNGYSFTYVICSLLFIPSQNPITGNPEPVLGLGWTLNYEMFFYAILFLMLLVGIRRLWLSILIVFSSLVALGALFGTSDVVLKSWTHTIVLEFVFGAMIAQLRLSGLRISAPWRIAASVAGVAAWLGILQWPIGNGGDLRGLVWGVPAAAVVFGVVMNRAAPSFPRFVMLVGDASYSLYLTHLFVMRVCALFAYHLPVSEVCRTVVFVAIFPPAAVIFSILSYRKFELPTMRFGRQLIQSRFNKHHLSGQPEIS